jgi:hypothetical protein
LYSDLVLSGFSISAGENTLAVESVATRSSQSIRVEQWFHKDFHDFIDKAESDFIGVGDPGKRHS